MRKLQVLVLLMAFFTLQSCKKTDSSYEATDTESFVGESTEAYPDGTYSADIDYYNPDTGTRSTYTLNIEVASNEVTVIQWPNGGWLDSSHFSPEELDNSGSCSITTYDGKQYDIQITGPETAYTDDARVRSDSEGEKAAVTCPECGGTKSDYDDLCYDCTSKHEEEEQSLLDQE